MKVSLVGINSKYMHTSLALRYLKMYAKNQNITCELHEFTINNDYNKILSSLYEQNSDIYAFSVYIFNVLMITDIMHDLKKLRPNAIFICGGPEVSFEYDDYITKNHEIDFIVRSEGEETFTEFLKICENIGITDINSIKKHMYENKIAGLSFIYENNIIKNPDRTLIKPFDKVVFPYEDHDLDILKNRILYYESSRGCPYNCTYCLSSVQAGVRAFEIPRVFRDLKKFLDHNVRQVKFVDRTFNYNKNRSVEIFKFLIDNDNKITNFHFEISPMLLNTDIINVVSKARKGLFQFEIGVQSSNEQTLRNINRTEFFDKIVENIKMAVNCNNIHVHLDLIAGLPFESYEIFQKSFNDVMSLNPEYLQVGFLKILKGTTIKQGNHGYIYSDKPPYEVFENFYLTYDEIIILKKIEELVELYFNGKIGTNVIKFYSHIIYENNFFKFFESFALFLDKKDFFEVSHKTSELFNVLYEFVLSKLQENEMLRFHDIICYDLYSFDNVFEKPNWLKTVNNSLDLLDKILTDEQDLILSQLDSFEQNNFKQLSVKQWKRNAAVVKFDFNKNGEKKKNIILFLYHGIRKSIIIE